MNTKEKICFNFILILFILLPFFYGMYYEFCGALMTICTSGIIIFILHTEKKLQISLSMGLFMSVLFTCCYFISIPYAVDSGIAALGVIKMLWIPLFIIAYSQLSSQKREKIFSKLPYIGAALCLIGFAAYFLPWIKDYFYVNGRLSSGFQYANTFALFLLIGIILLFDKKEIKWKDYISGVILLFGIALSGSRTVFIFTALTLLYLIIKHRNLKLLSGTFFLTILFLIYLYTKGNITNIGRISTFSFRDSTFLGRLLYTSDALTLLQKHPFGMGHMGYYYMENEIQTGVYSVQYVHNDLLQIGLDIGWIPMFLYFIAVIYCLISKQLKHFEKLILSVLFIHGLFDFDLAYGAIQCIVFLIMNNQDIPPLKKWKGSLYLSGKKWLIVFPLFFLAGIYLSIPLIARYQNLMEISIKWYPWDTEAKLQLLSESEDAYSVDQLADEILQQNDTCALAYYAKATVADCNNDYKKMIQYQKKSIERNYFSHEAYSNYAYMLYNGACYAVEKDNDKIYNMCCREIIKLPSYMETAKKRLGKLGKMINDQPDLKPDEDMKKMIEAISEDYANQK